MDLDFNCPMGVFTEEQHELISDTVMMMFGPSRTKDVEYILKVVFPEALVKIYMDVKA